MPTYRLTPDAQSDLIEIRRFTVAEWGPVQSQNYVEALQKTIHLLTEAPSIGLSRPEVGPQVLSFPHGSHVIYYKTVKQQLVIFGVLHKSMVPLNHLVARQII